LKYTRTLVTELSPPVLRDHGLPAGLTWLGEYMQKHDVTVTVTVPDEELQLPENQTVLLFQSVRELLINSSKHAGTREATVAMEHSDGLLRIEVRDEGVGFNLAAVGKASAEGVSSKFGLFSIGERMRALGGSLEIESVPGKGTTATLILPLRTSDEWIVERGQRVVGREQKTAGAASAEGQVDREENVMGGERARAVHPNIDH
jgi:signal transduction histidine kinase